MSIVFTADVHAHAYPDSQILPDGKNKQLQDIVACLDRAREEAAKSDPREVVVLGDLFHDRKGVRPEALHAIGAWIRRCQSSKVGVTLLVGNHDLSSGGDGGTSVMAAAGGARIVETVSVVLVGDVPMGFIPYTENAAEVAKASAALARAGAKVLCAHLGIGDPAHADCVPTDYEVPGTIQVSHLRPDHFSSVLLGHYHNPQDLGKGVRYLGSPLQLSFKEVGQAKRMCALNAKTLKLTDIVNTWSPKFRKLTAAEAVQQLSRGSIPDTDRLWVTDATPDDVAALRTYKEDAGRSIRVDRRRDATAVTVRVDANASEEVRMAQFIRSVRPGEAQDTIQRLIARGSRFLEQSKKV
jgi:DNA repair exonuclease SbcCD nuclease subunit